MISKFKLHKWMIDKWGIVIGTVAHETCTFSNVPTKKLFQL